MTADIFFKELQRLLLLQPKRPSQTLNSENCKFTNFVYYCKDLFNCFDCTQTSNGTYLFDCHNVANSADMNFTFETELSYECVDAFKCFNCSYVELCSNMTDSDFSTWCNNCHDVFGCFKLNNKSFCIFNRQFTETEYREKVKYLKTLPPEKILEEVEKIASLHPITQTNEHDNENSNYGNYTSFCSNCYLCFDATKNESCGYLYDSSRHSRSFDVSQSGDTELSYQVLDSGLIFNSSYIMWSKSCQDSTYLFDCLDVKDSLGCVMLSHKQYCFLNRQLTKEEYEKVTQPLLEELKTKNYEWSNLVY